MNNRMKFWTLLVSSLLLAGTSAGAQMHDHTPMVAGDGQFNPFVVADNHGGFFVAYVERKGGKNNVMLEHSEPARAAARAIQVNDRPGDGAVRNENPPKLAVGPNNEVYVVWASERERWKGNIRLARSLNGGKTFEAAIDLNSDASAPPISRAFESIAVDVKGRIYVAWIDERNKTSKDRGAEIWMAVSDDHGRTFSHDRKILSNVCECCRTAIAIDSSGRIYISYRLVPSAGPMYRDIGVARSDDRGKTFTLSIVNQDRWELNACPIDGATMAIDGSDRVHIVWFTQTGELPRLYISSSTDHAVTFAKPILFDPNQKLAKHAHIVPGPGNRLLIAWDDLDNGSVIKWGVFDPSARSLKVVGTQRQASYPIIAISGNQVSLVALQPDRPHIFRHVQTAEF